MNSHRPLLRALTALSLSCLIGAANPKAALEAHIKSLKPTQVQSFNESIAEARRLIMQKRVFEAMEPLQVATDIIPAHPTLVLLQANADVLLRKLDSAEERLQGLMKDYPYDSGVVFNLAEVYFIQSRWDDAITYFTKAAEIMAATQQKQLHTLTEFKIYICHKKKGNVEVATEYEEQFDFTSDTPAYYISQFIKHSHAEDEEEAQRWLAKAKRIFSSQEMGIWEDTLKEAGYVSTIISGGDRYFNKEQ